MSQRPKTVVVVQSNYIPWKGYFDLMNMADEFILYDDIQYTKRDWRNRNLIKTPGGLQWLTIPVEVKGKYHQRIDETLVSDAAWGRQHWASITHNYTKAPYFKQYAPRFEALYAENGERYLSRINRAFIEAVCGILGIATRLSWSSDYGMAMEGRNERLIALCREAGGARYLTGPLAKEYIRPELFAAANIELCYMDYSGYPEYPQLYGAFEHGVTVLDLIFNHGPQATRFMKSFA